MLIEGNHIYDCGNVGSLYEHQTYTETQGIIYQYNHTGPLLSGASGNNLKDRSAGLVVRYNTLHNGNRELDLIDSEYQHIREDRGRRVQILTTRTISVSLATRPDSCSCTFSIVDL